MTPRATVSPGPPVRALDRYQLLDHQRQPRARRPLQRRQGRRHGSGRGDRGVHALRPGPARRRARADWLYPASPQGISGASRMAVTARKKSPKREQLEGAAARAGRLAGGALGPRRRRQVLPLPQRPERHQLAADARLGDADGVHRPGDHGRDPGDVLQAGSRQGVRVDPVHHERPRVGLARARHAPLGRERLHHPALPPHGPRVPVRRLQVSARAELADRRAPARARHVRRLHRLPAAVGPDGVLGDGRRHQHQRHRPVRRARSSRTSCAAAQRSARRRSHASTRYTCCSYPGV